MFLDELGELSLDLQPKLLRVLEQRELRRVGGTKTIKVDLRVIAATRKDLRSEVEKGKFREDLYFRLNVVPITAPPLRERREDIPLLIDSHARQARARAASQLSEATRAALMAHDWPGNVRELRNVIERALALGADPGMLVAPLGDDRGRRKGAQLRDAHRVRAGRVVPRHQGEVERAVRAPLPDVADQARRRQHLEGRARRRHGSQVPAQAAAEVRHHRAGDDDDDN